MGEALAAIHRPADKKLWRDDNTDARKYEMKIVVKPANTLHMQNIV